MNYERIKQELKEIVDITSSVPDILKEKCFEVLLNKLLAEEVSQKPNTQDALIPTSQQNLSPENKIPLQAVVRAFMQRTGVTEDELNAVMLYENGEIHFIYEPTTKTVAQGQIEWSLLLALKKAVLSGEFSVDPEDVRSICKDKGYYSQDNFARHFKQYKDLFKGAMVAQGSPQSLTPEGLRWIRLFRVEKGLV